MNNVVLGSLELVTLPEMGVFDVLAKVDTGAWSGALHCTNIREHEGVLSFWPLGKKELKIQTDEYVKSHVTSANGQMAIRYLVATKIIVKDIEYDTVIGLSDRARMSRQMLIGRRFLIENEMLVDVSSTRAIDDEAETLL